MCRMTKLPYRLYITLILYCGLFNPVTLGSLTDNNTIEDSSLLDPILDKDIPLAKSSFTELRFVSAAFRHGDRTPEIIETYPTDLYKNYTYYPTGRGQLTNIGMKRAYRLGLMLRKLYDLFLGPVYYQPHVYARSTYVARCKMTLQLVLAALFPPTSMQKWNNNLLWQPINAKYGSENGDNLLMTFKSLEFQEAIKKAENSPEILEKIKKYRDLMKEVSAYAGMNVTTLYDLALVRMVIHMHLSMKLELPEEAHALYANKQLLEATRLGFSVYAHNEHIIRLGGGVLLRKIIENMNRVINGTLTDRKINLFSAHDINLIGLLGALHRKDDAYIMPEYTSSVIFELRAKNDKYFVKVLYYNGIPGQIQALVIPGCELLCPYNKFLQLTSTTIATDTDLTGPMNSEENMLLY